LVVRAAKIPGKNLVSSRCLIPLRCCPIRLSLGRSIGVTATLFPNSAREWSTGRRLGAPPTEGSARATGYSRPARTGVRSAQPTAMTGTSVQLRPKAAGPAPRRRDADGWAHTDVTAHRRAHGAKRRSVREPFEHSGHRANSPLPTTADGHLRYEGMVGFFHVGTTSNGRRPLNRPRGEGEGKNLGD